MGGGGPQRGGCLGGPGWRDKGFSRAGILAHVYSRRKERSGNRRECGWDGGLFVIEMATESCAGGVGGRGVGVVGGCNDSCPLRD